MKLPKPGFTPDWLFTYTGVMLLLGVAVNWGAGFTQFAHSLTLPSMEVALELSHTKAGLVITLTNLVRIFSTFTAGTMAPRYGSRFIIGLGTVGAGCAMIMLGLAQTYPLVLLSAAFMGIGTGMALAPMMGLLSRWFQLGDRGLAAGLASMGGSFAFIFAGVVVPWLVGSDPDDGWRHSWFVFGALAITIGIISLVFLRDRARADAREEQPTEITTGQDTGQDSERSQRAWPMAAYKSPMIWLATFLAFNSGWSQGVFNAFFGVYLSQESGIGLGTVGQLVILIGVLSITSGTFWGALSDRASRGQAFFYSYLLQAIAFALMALFPGIISFIIAAILIGFTLRAAYTICAACSGDYVAVQFSAAAFGLMSVGAGLGNALSPTVGGAIADNFGMNWSFALATIGSVVGMAGSVVLIRRPASHQRV
ncbi:MAG: MFS transporter [SAR202 cluster bacterium]|nr:MFS transporter [SAR202 cluster bacterium]